MDTGSIYCEIVNANGIGLPKKTMDVILIDGKNFCHRHAWTRRMLRTTKGFPTGCIFGCLSGMMRLNRYYPGAAMIFCWDGEDTNNSWRHKIAASYKENRRKAKKGEKPQEIKDLYMQIPKLKSLLQTMGYLQIEVPTLEADDLIGLASRTLSKKVDRVFIYSSDKDFFQLIKKNVYLIRDQKKDKNKKCAPITAKQIETEFGVLPETWNKFRAFVGDKGDDVHKPIKGLGPKTVKAILAMGSDPSKDKGCKSDKVKGCWKDVRLNYSLVKIVRKVNDKRLPSDVRKQVKAIIDKLKEVNPKKLVRSNKGKSKESYREILKLLAKYELVTLLEARHLLWKLP